MGITPGEEALFEISSLGIEVIGVAADLPPPNGHRNGDGVLGKWMMAAGEMEVLLEVGGFDCGRRYGDDLIVHIDLGRGGVPN